MDTVGQYVTHVSTQMNDQRPSRAFTRWGRGLLLDYLNLGLNEIGTYRPEAFAKDVIIDLVAGATQTTDYSKTIVALSSNMDGTPILPGDIEMATAFNAYAICPIEPRIINGEARYLVRSFALDKHNKHKFYVDPPVPKGLVVQVNASITGEVPQYTLADWDKPIVMESKFSGDLVDYMMAKAFELDMESAQSRSNSQSLFKKFYDVMGVKYKMESRYRSGNYLGEVGSNPRAGNS
jgi:hypothetical protein